MNKIITWNTEKVEGGYMFSVYTFAYQAPSETLQTGLVATRAQATHKAKAWTRYYKDQQRARA